jgi:ATP-dependent helicase/nuclease subunit A
LLREQAIAAAVSPDFVEVEDAVAREVGGEFFREYVSWGRGGERGPSTAALRASAQDDGGADSAQDDGGAAAVILSDAPRRGAESKDLSARPELDTLRALGIEPATLLDAMFTIDANPDVTFTAIPAPPPSVDRFRTALQSLLDAALPLLPSQQPDNGWDALQRTVRRLSLAVDTIDWSSLPAVVRLAESIEPKSTRTVTLNRWRAERSAQAPVKALKEQAVEFGDGPLATFLRDFRVHCHAPVLAFAQRAAQAWSDERARRDLLTFEDLLRLAAKLLRERPDARAALGLRWRHLLVDEFQDTDPLQAEVCLLLASPPESGNDWRRVQPRDGALFVVGDPKQSIYRFRRADIQTYELVRKRFAEFGQVVRLTANFRSTHAIGAVVNEHFRKHFASTDDPQSTQAPFAELSTLTAPLPGQGVFRYPVTPPDKRADSLYTADAELVASYIAREIAAQRAVPQDFLVLTWRKRELAAHAAALAARNIPAVTSGAESDSTHELQELRQLIDALSEPTDMVQVVGALEGLFVGATPADLYAAQQRGIVFTIAEPPPDQADVVATGLARLHGWFQLSEMLSPASLLDRLLDETGLLAYATSQFLGDRRAGLLLGLVDAVRDVAAEGGDLAAIRSVIDATISSEEREFTVLPGLTRAVRVMNVHKAKGLEAPIVFLAANKPGSDRAPGHIVHRDAVTGAAHGVLRITSTRGFQERVVSQPADWDDWVATEARLSGEERERLLYVAITRASHSLWIATPTTGDSPWSALTPALDACTVPEVPITVTPAAGRDGASATRRSVLRAIDDAQHRRQVAAVGTVRFTAVTAEAKRALDATDDAPITRVRMAERGTGDDGRQWGTAVHDALEAALRLDGQALAERLEAIVWHSLDEGQPDDARAAMLVALSEVVAAARAHPTWAALHTPGRRWTELPIAHVVEQNGERTVREGVIDAVHDGAEGWTVVDWKSDRVSASAWASRVEGYTRQVGLYAEALQALSGRVARGAVVHLRAGAPVDQRDDPVL